MRRRSDVGRAALALCILAACSTEPDRDAASTVEPPATVASPESTSTTAITTAISTTTTTSITTSPATGTAPAVVFDLLHSPANATAEVVGRGATTADPVTVDGEPADVTSFVTDVGDTFTAQIRIPDEGPHTVCVGDTCGRVYTLAADALSPIEVVAQIEEAIEIVGETVPYTDWFPDWTIEIGGALSGTGGITDDERKVVTVFRNRDRTVDDFVRTILHELGHVADAERMDDDARAAYLIAAGYEPGTAWRDPDARRIEDWARQPAEDFAEVLVSVWTDGRWTPRTREAVDVELAATVIDLTGLGRPVSETG